RSSAADPGPRATTAPLRRRPPHPHVVPYVLSIAARTDCATPPRKRSPEATPSATARATPRERSTPVCFLPGSRYPQAAEDIRYLAKSISPLAQDPTGA